MSLQSVAQSENPGERVSLYRLDATSLGGSIYHFTPGRIGDDPIVFGGVEYSPWDVEVSGFETNGSGALPTPHIKVANSTPAFQAVVNSYGDLLGCPIQRVRTFKRFLDGQPDADPTAYWGPDAFRVERKVSENILFIEWEMSASLDQEGKMIPGRVVIRDTCLWRYRRHVASGDTFDYSSAQCPYTGTFYFNAMDEPTLVKSEDVPSRRISCCKARFGNAAALPYGGFPGVARVNR